MERESVKPNSKDYMKPNEFENKVIKRLTKRRKIVQKKQEERASLYVNIANRYFSNYSEKLAKSSSFSGIERDLLRGRVPLVLKSYISLILFTTFLSVIISVLFGFVLFLIYGVGALLVVLIPLITFISLYIYPSLESRSNENSVNQELPFATIHMSAIAGAMIEPSKIFQIIIATKEYPNLSKEFTKIINEINILGYDLISALRNSAANTPSKKLAELLNGIATTIQSGGDLPAFFNKRAETLLFDYRIEREKYTRSSETFMDIYISVVIAAPMIFMLLLMIMQISNLGISLSPSMLSLIMVLGVGMINVFFLMFLHLKQPIE